MPTYTEPLHAGAFLLSQGNGSISHDAVTIVSGAGILQPGTVLGKITATGKYKAYDNDAADGSETAAGILFSLVDAASADVSAHAVRRLAEVSKAHLQWSETVTTQDEKDAAYVDLTALTIICRD